MWRDEKIKVDIPENIETVYVNPPVLSDIPLNKGDSRSGAEAGGLNDYQGFDKSGNWKINPEILKKVIVDIDGNYYKIVPMEYDFLIKHELPLPEIHWLERIKLGFKI
jgi:predicted nucleotidyltransferase